MIPKLLAGTLALLVSCNGIMPLIEDVPFADTTYVTTAFDLASKLDNPNLLIIDARDTLYEQGHIPGAINVSWVQLANSPDLFVTPSPTILAPMLDSLGISPSKEIVVYADPIDGWGEEGRIVWMLRMAGIAHSKILDGGYPYWQDQKYEISTEPVSPVASSSGVTTFDSSFTISTQELSQNLNRLAIIDSRTLEEYNGATPYGEARGGHIPTAIHFHYREVYRKDGTFKGQAELETLFGSLGISDSDTIVPYCTAGVRSGLMTIVLRMAGYSSTRNYDASFYGWAADSELPIE